MKKVYIKVAIPAAILLCGVISLSQVAGNGKWPKDPPVQTVSPEDNASETRVVIEDDPWNEWEKIQKAFNQTGSVYYSGTITLAEEEGNRTLEQIPFSYEKHEDDFIYRIDSVEFIQEKGISWNVYHKEKLVISGKAESPVSIMQAYSSIDSLRKRVSTEGATAEVLVEGKSKVIKINNSSSPDCYGYEVVYNPEDYKIKKILLSMATPDNFSEPLSADQKTKEMERREEETAIIDDSGKGNPSIELNLYKLEISFDQFKVLEKNKRFKPLQAFGSFKKSVFQLNNAYQDYRLVWLSGAKK